jgi:hypothetical protein
LSRGRTEQKDSEGDRHLTKNLKPEKTDLRLLRNLKAGKNADLLKEGQHRMFRQMSGMFQDAVDGASLPGSGATKAPKNKKDPNAPLLDAPHDLGWTFEFVEPVVRRSLVGPGVGIHNVIIIRKIRIIILEEF